MKSPSSFPHSRLQATALLHRYERFLLHLKAQTSYLIQKYTFFQFRQKLGFPLAYSDRKLQTLTVEEATEGRFAQVVTTALREYIGATGLSNRRAVKVLARSLGVGSSTVHHWMSTEQKDFH